MYKIGDKVKIKPENDNENYDEYREQPLTVTHVARNAHEHPGFDEGLKGSRLYDFVDSEGKDVPFSLYDYEITTHIERYKSISELGKTIDELYAEKKYERTFEITVHLSDKPCTFGVILRDRHGFDCKVSSFGANLWFRTRKGVNKERYSRIQDLQAAIVRRMREYVNFEGDITFSLNESAFEI